MLWRYAGFSQPKPKKRRVSIAYEGLKWMRFSLATLWIMSIAVRRARKEINGDERVVPPVEQMLYRGNFYTQVLVFFALYSATMKVLTGIGSVAFWRKCHARTDLG